MYSRFYNLKKEPFHVTPDPEFFYLSPTHKEALASIIYGVTAGKGFIVITGEVGVGKTTVLRSYLERINGKKSRIVYVFNPNISFKELLQNIFQELNIDPKTGDINQMVTRLHHLMIDECKEGRSIVLLIDEAHNMPLQTLENLRMLSNLETSSDKLMQIVLVGQPEFEEILNRKELRQLKQRVAVHSIITPLNTKESLAYIQHRLTKAGMNHTPVFTRVALRKIVKRARGIPRVINILCDNALIAGVGYRKKPVNSTIVDHVIADYNGEKPSSLKWWMSVSGAAALGAVCVFLLSPYSEALRSTVGNNYRRILGKTPSGVVVPVNTQENSSVTVVAPTAEATAPEPSVVSLLA
jgi:general secretion pathway protein A